MRDSGGGDVLGGNMEACTQAPKTLKTLISAGTLLLLILLLMWGLAVLGRTDGRQLRDCQNPKHRTDNNTDTYKHTC